MFINTDQSLSIFTGFQVEEVDPQRNFRTSKRGTLVNWAPLCLMHENETRIFIANPRRHTGQIKVTARIRVLRGKTKPKGFLQLLAGGKEELQLDAERVTRGFAAFAKTTKANSFHYLPHTSLSHSVISSKARR